MQPYSPAMFDDGTITTTGTLGEKSSHLSLQSQSFCPYYSNPNIFGENHVDFTAHGERRNMMIGEENGCRKTKTLKKNLGGGDDDGVLKLTVTPKHDVVDVESDISTIPICITIAACDRQQHRSCVLQPRQQSSSSSSDAASCFCDDDDDDGTTRRRRRRIPLDLIIALDLSSSMNGWKLQLCKRTIQLLVRQMLDSCDRFGLITYSNVPQTEFPLQKMTTGNKHAVNNAIQALTCGHGTNVSSAISLAFTEMHSAKPHPNSERKIFLLTDGGHASHEVTDPNAIVQLARTCSGQQHRTGTKTRTKRNGGGGGSDGIGCTLRQLWRKVSGGAHCAPSTTACNIGNRQGQNASMVDKSTLSSPSKKQHAKQLHHSAQRRTKRVNLSAPVEEVSRQSPWYDNPSTSSPSSPQHARDVTLVCFGYGNHHDKSLLQDLAKVTCGGRYFHVRDGQDLGIAFRQALGGNLWPMIAKEVVLNVQVSKPATKRGVRIERIHRDQGGGRDDVQFTSQTSFEMALDDFYAGETRDILIDVRLAMNPTTGLPALSSQKPSAAALREDTSLSSASSIVDDMTMMDHRMDPVPHVVVGVTYKDVLREGYPTCDERSGSGCASDTVVASISRPYGSQVVSTPNAYVSALEERLSVFRHQSIQFPHHQYNAENGNDSHSTSKTTKTVTRFTPTTLNHSGFVEANHCNVSKETAESDLKILSIAVPSKSKVAGSKLISQMTSCCG